MSAPSPGRRLIGELKRRKVFRVAGVYAATAFVVWQASSFVLPALDFPGWALDLVVVLSLLGFPIALVLAWALEVTPDGVRRTGRAATGGEDDTGGDEVQPPRYGARHLLAVFAAGVLVALAGYAAYRGATVGASGPDDEGAPGFAGGRAEGGSASPVQSVAVLPFADMSSGGDQVWFADGVAEEILDALAGLTALDVKARSSSFQFRGTTPDVRMVGDSLRVGAVLEGSVRRYGERVRVTVQLVRTSDGSHLWSETYERRFTDIFDIQDEIARHVADALRVELEAGGEGRLAGAGTDDMLAYQVYLKGREALQESEGREAFEIFGLATDFDSTFASAWAARAEAAFETALRDAPTTPEVLHIARREAAPAVERALALDSTLSAGHAVRARLLDFQHRWDEAEASWKRALELTPSDAGARGGYAMHLAARGDWTGALEQARRAVDLDPLHAEAVKRYADMLLYAGRLPEAEERLRHVLDLDIEFYRVKAQTQLATVYVRQDRDGAAVEAGRRAVDRWAVSDAPQWMRLWTRLRLAAVHGAAGHAAEARRGFAALKDTAPEHAYEHMVSAVHAAMGEADSAFAWLDRSRPDTWPPRRVVQLRGQPWWEPVRDDPRFGRLLGRMGVNE